MFTFILIGLAAGMLNGLFGAGGGLAAVPLLVKSGLEPKKAHATSVAVMVPLSAISLMFYIQGGFAVTDALIFIPGGIAGAAAGSFLLKKMSNTLLRRIFGAVMIISAIRLLTK